MYATIDNIMFDGFSLWEVELDQHGGLVRMFEVTDDEDIRRKERHYLIEKVRMFESEESILRRAQNCALVTRAALAPAGSPESRRPILK